MKKRKSYQLYIQARFVHWLIQDSLGSWIAGKISIEWYKTIVHYCDILKMDFWTPCTLNVIQHRGVWPMTYWRCRPNLSARYIASISSDYYFSGMRKSLNPTDKSWDYTSHILLLMEHWLPQPSWFPSACVTGPQPRLYHWGGGLHYQAGGYCMDLWWIIWCF